MSMNPPLNDIAVFVEVAKNKSFTRAAEALGMPVSTVSRRVNELERYIGVPLLNRNTRKVELTEAGTLYFERCQHVIDVARVAHEELLVATQQPKGRLRVSMPTSFAMMFMSVILHEFSKMYPEIQCEFDLSPQPVNLLTDPFDLVIRFGQQRDSSLISRQIGLVDLGLYASTSYLAQYGTPTTPADLAHHNCLRVSAKREDSVWELWSGTRCEKVQVSGRMAMNNAAMLGRMAVLDMGVVPLPDETSVRNFETHSLVRVLPDWKFSSTMLSAMFPSRLMPVRARVFIEFLEHKLAERRGQNVGAAPIAALHN